MVFLKNSVPYLTFVNSDIVLKKYNYYTNLIVKF